MEENTFVYHHKNGIWLRKVEEDDLDLLKSLKDDSWYGTHHTAIVNMADQKRWFDKVTVDPCTLYLIAEARGPALASKQYRDRVGLYKVTNIDWMSHCYDSAHDIFGEARGKGFSNPVLEAGVDFGFEVLGMHRINTEVLANNWSVKAVLWAGYTQEGVKRKSILKNGFWIDSMCFGILREDWVKLERVIGYGGICNTDMKLKI